MINEIVFICICVTGTGLAFALYRDNKKIRKRKKEMALQTDRLNNAAKSFMESPEFEALKNMANEVESELLELPGQGFPDECFSEVDPVMGDLLSRVCQTGKPASGTIDYIGDKAVSYTIDDEDEP